MFPDARKAYAISKLLVVSRVQRELRVLELSVKCFLSREATMRLYSTLLRHIVVHEKNNYMFRGLASLECDPKCRMFTFSRTFSAFHCAQGRSL